LRSFRLDSGSRLSGSERLRRLDVVKNVFFDDASAWAGTLKLTGIESFFLNEMACRGGGKSLLLARRLRRPLNGRLSFFFWRWFYGFTRVLSRLYGSVAVLHDWWSFPGFRVFFDPADHRADGDRFALGDGNAQNACCRSGNFGCGLFGLQLEERFVGPDQ